MRDAKGCFSPTERHIWPYEFVMHLLNVAVSKGVNLHTNTNGTRIPDMPNEDGTWTVTTDRGSIRAKKVVLVLNGYVAGIALQDAQKIVPSRGICSVSSLRKDHRPHLPIHIAFDSAQTYMTI